MLRLSGFTQQPFMKAQKCTGQLGSSTVLGKPQPFLTGHTPTSVSIGRSAGGWHVCNDLTHMPERLAESSVMYGTDPCASLPPAS